MAMKYTNTFHCKSLQNVPKLVFLVRKYMYHLAMCETECQQIHATIAQKGKHSDT
jgi:hypothetical protein